jgi:hypothetical protein
VSRLVVVIVFMSEHVSYYKRYIGYVNDPRLR